MKWLVYAWIALCAACSSETAGELVGIRWSVGAPDGGGEREFVTDTGWQVSLEEARLGIETVSAIAPDAERVGAVARLSRLIVPVARAHGGHDDAYGRRVRAELLEVLALDLLADAPERPRAEAAEAGPIGILKIELARDPARLPSELHGFQAYARGSAERDGKRVSFAGGVKLATNEAARRVETRVKFELSEGGTLALTVRPSEWFREAEFDRLPAADSDEPSEIAADNQVGRAFAIGVRSPEAFEVSWKD